jgi:hypothetical protein
MSFTTLGLTGVVAFVVALAGTALALQRRERRREAWFDAEISDLRGEMPALEARALLGDSGRETPIIEIRKAELDERLRAALRAPAGDHVPAAAS